MASSRRERLRSSEAVALALADAARELDHADDAAKFLGALERNHRLWNRIGQVAARRSWTVPDRRMVDYALKTTGRTSGRAGRDDQIHALIDINRQVSLVLAEGGDMDRIRKRAHALWERQGRAKGEDLEHWLIAAMDAIPE